MWNEDKEAEAEESVQAIGEGEDIRWDFHSEIFHQDICKVFGGRGLWWALGVTGKSLWGGVEEKIDGGRVD